MGGPNQAGDNKKCPINFEGYVEKLTNSTDKPIIITEFGQSCQPTHGASESCSGTYEGKTMGYDETILTIAQKYSVSWLPWSWRPMAAGPNTKNCQDVNGGTDPAGLSLAHPTDGKELISRACGTVLQRVAPQGPRLVLDQHLPQAVAQEGLYQLA